MHKTLSNGKKMTITCFEDMIPLDGYIKEQMYKKATIIKNPFGCKQFSGWQLSPHEGLALPLEPIFFQLEEVREVPVYVKYEL